VLGRVVETADTGVAREVTGGGGCTVGPSVPGALWWLVVLHLLLRSAWAADVQTLQPVGDDFVGLRSPVIGTPWSARAVATADLALRPLAWRTAAGRRTDLVKTATTGTVFGSLSVGRYVRVGAGLPVHHLTGELYGLGAGDLLLQAVVGDDEQPVAVVVEVERALPYRLAAYGRNAVAGGFVGRQGIVGWQVMARLQPDDIVFGTPTSSQLTSGLGLHGRVGDRLDVTTELLVGMPLAIPRSVVEVPAEVLVSGRWDLGGGVGLRLASGLGLTAGLGTPRGRVLVQIVGHRAPRDPDQDGYVGLRDLCPTRAEDRDAYRDGDGCPDLDNDRDGFADVDDACPDEPETVNGLRDDDGCPDAPAGWRITVHGPETFQLTVDDGPPVRWLGPEDWTYQGVAGPRRVHVEADGHASRVLVADLVEGRVREDVVYLEPLQLGRLVLRVEDAQGNGIDAIATIEGVDHVVQDGRLTRDEPAGRPSLRVTAAGFVPVEDVVTLEANAETTHTVVLERPVVVLDGNRLATSGSPFFAVDADRLTDSAPLDALAAWIREHPEVLLLRVEGHADPLGPSAYNYALSVRRAEGVAAALVERGIDRSRLQVVGAGESLAGEGPVRQVGFTVLVWNEERRTR
jgi:outer membrane protein OmpA-like peptidoglycan-associated protein